MQFRSFFDIALSIQHSAPSVRSKEEVSRVEIWLRYRCYPPTIYARIVSASPTAHPNHISDAILHRLCCATSLVFVFWNHNRSHQKWGWVKKKISTVFGKFSNNSVGKNLPLFGKKSQNFLFYFYESFPYQENSNMSSAYIRAIWSSKTIEHHVLSLLMS